jgi:hypothetical protein
MKLIYTHPNRLIVENIKNLLENDGIEVILQNQYAGGGVGELAPIDAWPELWLAKESDLERAMALMESVKNTETEKWVCKNCGEENGGSFEMCWACAKDR